MEPKQRFTAWRLVRSGASAPTVEQSAQRARPFGAAAAQVPWSAFLTGMFDDSGVASYLIAPPAQRSAHLATTLSSAVAARADQIEDLPAIGDTNVIGRLRVRPATFAAHETQFGGDPTEVALAVTRALRPGQWVAATMRKASRYETRAARRWFAWRQVATTHYSTEAECLVVSLYAGGGTTTEVQSLLSQVAASIPGFELETVAEVPRPVARAAVVAGLGLVAWLAGVHFGHDEYGSLAGGGIDLTGYWGAVRPLTQRHSDTLSVLLPPRHRHLPPRSPLNAKTLPNGRQRASRSGDYPLHGRAMLMGPGMILGLASPHAGTASSVAVSRQRPVPAAMSDPSIGPLVGNTATDQAPVHISASDAYAGVGLLGMPGTGKTELVHHLWAWNCAARHTDAGTNNALIAIENKGDGAAGYIRWAKDLGVDVELVDLLDPSTASISMFDGPGSATDKAARFLDSMIYHWGRNDIQGRAAEALTASLVAAFSCPLDMHIALGYDTSLSVIDLAHILLGGDGDERAKMLAARIAELHRNHPTPDLFESVRQLAPFFETGTTPSQRRTLTESSRNKMRDLRNAGSWWSADRSSLTWDEILTDHRAIVVNVGFSEGMRQAPSERTSNAIAALLTHQLRSSIMRVCAGWRDQGRSVSVFADELSLLASTSDEVVAWMRNQGRAYGVRSTFAAQYPEQLTAPVRTALLSFGTIFWFRQTVPSVTAEAVTYLSADGTEWSAADLVGLENYHAIVAATVGGRRQPAVTIAVGNWAGDPDGFLEAQGFDAAAVRGNGRWW